MTRTERVLRDLASALAHFSGCSECVSLDDAMCSSKHYGRLKQAMGDARRLIRQLDSELEAAKKKPS